MIFIMCILFVLLTSTIYLFNKYFILPITDTIPINYKHEYFLNDTTNYFEKQKKFECAGYSIAYVLRNQRRNVNGEETYKIIKNKLPFGFVAPKSIVDYLTRNNINSTYYSGTIESLKSRLQNGIPIIIFLKVFNNRKYYHYNVLTGYDDNTLFFVDSLSFLQNSNKHYSNREININDFINLWNVNIPFHSYTYIVIEKES